MRIRENSLPEAVLLTSKGDFEKPVLCIFLNLRYVFDREYPKFLNPGESDNFAEISTWSWTRSLWRISEY